MINRPTVINSPFFLSRDVHVRVLKSYKCSTPDIGGISVKFSVNNSKVLVGFCSHVFYLNCSKIEIR